MEKCKDRTKTPRRTKLETIDHYAGIGIIVLFGGLLIAIGAALLYHLPPHSLW